MKRILLSLLLLHTGALGAEELPARLDWSQRAVLGTPVSGVVETLSVHPGQRVKQGELLARLDERPFMAELRSARAAVKRLKLSLEEARRELERAEELYERTVISERERRLAEIAASQAEAEFQAAQAGLTTAEVNLDYARLKAPFEGIVVARHVEPGQSLANSLHITPIVTLAADRPMLARAWVEAARLAELSPGRAVGVVVDDLRLPGVIDRLGLEPEEAGQEGGRYEVLVRFMPGARQLRPGQPARIDLGAAP